MEEEIEVKGYYNGYSYVLILEDGSKMEFASEDDAQEYLKEQKEEC